MTNGVGRLWQLGQSPWYDNLTRAHAQGALTQLVRAGTFFIPASIGAQEGAFVVVFDALTGQAGLGLAAALVRRGRELIWIGLGLVVGWLYSAAPAPGADEGQAEGV